MIMNLDHFELLPTDIPFELDTRGKIKISGVDVSGLRSPTTEKNQDHGVYRKKSEYLPDLYPPLGDRAIGATVSRLDPDPNLAACAETVQILRLFLQEIILGIEAQQESVDVQLPPALAQLLFAQKEAAIKILGDGVFILSTQPAKPAFAGEPGEIAFTEGRYLCERTGESTRRANERAGALFQELFPKGGEDVALEALLASPETQYALKEGTNYEASFGGMPGDYDEYPAKLEPDIKVKLQMPLPKDFRLFEATGNEREDQSAHAENYDFMLELERQIAKLVSGNPRFLDVAFEKGGSAWVEMINEEAHPGTLQSHRRLIGPDGKELTGHHTILVEPEDQNENYILSIGHFTSREEGDYVHTTRHTYGVNGLQQRPQNNVYENPSVRVLGKQLDGTMMLEVTIPTALKMEYIGAKDLELRLTDAARRRQCDREASRMFAGLFDIGKAAGEADGEGDPQN